MIFLLTHGPCPIEEKGLKGGGTLTLADAVNVARHALKRGQQAEHNVENSFLLPRKVLHTNEFRLSGHFYIILPATLRRDEPGHVF